MVFTAHLREGKYFSIELAAPMTLAKAILVNYRGDNPVYVMLKQGIEDDGTAISILSKDSRQDRLNLEFHEGEELKFLVIGQGAVHLVGFFHADINPAGKIPTAKEEKEKRKRIMRGGLIVEEVRMGFGEEAKKGSYLDIAYTGIRVQDQSLIDKRKSTRPFSFRLQKWMFDEVLETGLLGIKAGGKRILTFYADWKFQANHHAVPIGAKVSYDIEAISVT